MRLVIRVGLSVAVLAVCTYLVWPTPHEMAGIGRALGELEFRRCAPYFAALAASLAVTHFARAWRWRFLLSSIGVEVPGGTLLAISSVGFMAMLVFPARLGELVRPALLQRHSRASGAEALGTIAAERVVDGLLVTIVVFTLLVAHRGPDSPSWMMPMAWGALGLFAAATSFLLAAIRWPDATVGLVLTGSGLRRFAPRLAARLGAMLAAMIRGFAVVRDVGNFAAFLRWTILYWTVNGLQIWVLALAFGLELPVAGAFAVMGILSVGIMLPNSPGLVGQYQYFAMLGFSLYLPAAVVDTDGLACALVMHGIQIAWYLGVAAVALASGRVALSELTRLRPAPAADRSA